MRFATRRAVAVLGIGALGAGLTACSDDGSPPNAAAPPPTVPAPQATTAAAPAYHPFNGGAKGLDNPVLAVKIENTRSALPQSGVRAADIVYVEQVEGGETRLMAIYSSTLPRTLGPVRSARVSDLEILRQYGRPAFAFSGVNSKFKKEIRRAPIYEVSQETGGSAYYRSGARQIPYNLYADPRDLLKRAPRADRPRDIGFRFGPAPEGGRPTRSFTARWPSASMGFTWSAKEKRWLTTHDGRTNTAAEGGVVGPQTVVVQYAKTTRSRYKDVNGAYTPVVHTVGSGRAVVLRDGKSYDVRWSRPSADRGTTYTTADGRPMTFATGQVWIVLVNDGAPKIP
ncbi:DUF3048 domain-containing protein [Thermomonospora cellulosilytica]|uniref:DUF3048 domain-containing protein n=1 Tax=Thermomonospora cellulosilytica TaxID=1411118 RepID=A0A7W3R9T3_9ACTN|nr:DUF3048 domain-containing protein [Thermomonospora cellulosilytica]MBA9005102.1 hypothetical protein [Thermomonospora cellulosilytica]